MRIWEWSRPAGYCCTGRQVCTSLQAWVLFVSTSQMVFVIDGAVGFMRLGSGKTMTAGAMAAELAELGVTYYRISAPEIVSGMSGESEKEIREIFAEAKASAPSLIFIDEIDAITGKRENAQREMERRIVAQLLTCMDDLGSRPPPAKGSLRDLEAQKDADAKAEDAMDEGEKSALAELDGTASPLPGTGAAMMKPVMVIGATNRPDALDSALRRAGRFDREILMGVPDEAARLSILRVLTSRLRLAGDFNLEELARRTPGYVGTPCQMLRVHVYWCR